jgi:Fe-S cluster biogenesis protein NfuA
MAETLLERVEKVLDENVRPAMAEHQGNVEIRSVEDGILKLRFLGRCSGCPGARLTLEGLVTEQVTQALPEIKDVVLVSEVSDELWKQAVTLMKSRRASC